MTGAGRILAVVWLTVVGPLAARAQWVERTLSPRTSHAMVFDSRRGAGVLVGGVTSGGLYDGKTWEWNGSIWRRRDEPGPSARSRLAMAYDEARGVTVLFGGMGPGLAPNGQPNGPVSGETWEWDGNVWRLRATTGPTPRIWHVMAYDSARHVCVLHGGLTAQAGARLGDTWEWDGVQWIQRVAPGPQARSQHAMAYDAARGRMVMYGGDVSDLNTWLWDGITWSSRGGSPMGQIRQFAMAYDSVRRVTVLNAGSTTWEWDGSIWTPIYGSYVGVSGQALAFDTHRSVTLLFGGATSGGGGGTIPPEYFATTYQWNGSAWTVANDPGPPPTVAAQMVYQTARQRTLLFGGQEIGPGMAYPFSQKTFEWDGSAWSNVAINGPSARTAHAMAYDEQRNVAVLFGGSVLGASITGETWEWDGGMWLKRSVAGPPARAAAVMAYDSVRGETVLFGGQDEAGFSRETWTWNGTSWTFRTATGPAGRTGHAMACDPTRGVIVLFGGVTSSSTYLDDTWEWDGALWTQRIANGPSRRAGHSMAFDAGSSVLVMLGGYGGGVASKDDVWEWNGQVWSLQFTRAPSSRSGSALAYDRHRRVFTMFGGYEPGGIGGDTWESRLAVDEAPVPLPASEAGAWIQRVIQPRNAPAMAYDEHRGVAVLFGGTIGANTQAGDTWEWNGARWGPRVAPGPSARAAHAMAYDTARGVTVLFGGLEGTVPVGDTWEWNGTSWLRRATTGPQSRYRHAMAYDAARKVTVLFGGITYVGGSYVNSGETWEWDGATWTQRPVAGPAPRERHAMAYDARRGVTVLFGGGVVGPVYPYVSSETWEWDGSQWLQLSAGAPSAREGAAMSYDSTRQVIVLRGGTLPYNANGVDTWEWDGLRWMERSVSEPSRERLAMAFDPVRGVALAFGGEEHANANAVPRGDTRAWDGANWTSRPGSGPQQRVGHAMVFDEARGTTLLFGGSLTGNLYGPSGETWLWDGRDWTQQPVAGPSPRCYHAMAYDSDRAVTVLFGGSDLATPVGDTWEWDGTAWTQRVVAGPPPRMRHAMAYDRARHVTVLFGGSGYGDTWEWNGAAWMQRMVAGPPGRNSHAMAYDPDRGVTVLFGGTPGAGGAAMTDTWEWDGTAWTYRGSSGPYGTGLMVYNTEERRIVAYEGGNLWEWGGQTWEHAYTSGPSRTDTAMTYDTVRRVSVVFGGNSAYPSSPYMTGETWEFGTPCATPRFVAQPQHEPLNPGAPVSMMAAAVGTGTTSYRWRRNGADLVDGGRISGVMTTVLTINPAAAADAGWYACVATNGCGEVVSNAAELGGCYANCDGSVTPPVLNVADFICFLSRFAAEDPYANCDGSTTPPALNVNDFLCFRAAFTAGCP